MKMFPFDYAFYNQAFLEDEILSVQLRYLYVFLIKRNN